jgi:hypothetical protein
MDAPMVITYVRFISSLEVLEVVVPVARAQLVAMLQKLSRPGHFKRHMAHNISRFNHGIFVGPAEGKV